MGSGSLRRRSPGLQEADLRNALRPRQRGIRIIRNVLRRPPAGPGGIPKTTDGMIELLDEAFDKKSWHGPNLRGSIRGVTAKQAAWRPKPHAHNIWELTLHAAYWKYVVRRRITGEKRGSFALRGSNFFPRPVELSERAWKAD